MEGQDSSYSEIYEENSNFFFVFMHISWCTRVLAQKMCVHAGIGLKFMYTHKHVFLGDFLGWSKYNLSNGDLRSVHKDMEGHKDVIYQVW